MHHIDVHIPETIGRFTTTVAVVHEFLVFVVPHTIPLPSTSNFWKYHVEYFSRGPLSVYSHAKFHHTYVI